MNDKKELSIHIVLNASVEELLEKSSDLRWKLASLRYVLGDTNGLVGIIKQTVDLSHCLELFDEELGQVRLKVIADPGLSRALEDQHPVFEVPDICQAIGSRLADKY